MKRSKFAGLLFYAATLIFLISCGGDGSKEQTSADSTTAETTTPVIAPEVNTIITTPENMMIVTAQGGRFCKMENVLRRA